MAVAVEVEQLTKNFGDVCAVNDVSFAVEEGEFVTLLGPSGCGKTTTLRLIAGLESVSAGVVSLRGKDVTSRPPYRRDVGVVFQNYALFPHMTVAENIVYGLRARRAAESDVSRRLEEVLGLVHLADLGHRFPAELSGGQQQRVALARALAGNPQVLLLDEPLSNLDAKLRLEMREEIRRIQTETGITAILVTHDQEEALSVSDRLVVMNKGNVEQIGPPHALYNDPATRFVADFVGRSVALSGTAARTPHDLHVMTDGNLKLRVRPESLADDGDRVLVVIKEERVRILEDGEQADNEITALCESHTYLGASVRFKCRLTDDLWVSAIADAGREPMQRNAGEVVRLGWSIDDSAVIKL